MKIYLIRHGETDWNREGRIQGQEDIPLNENGRRAARQTALALGSVPFQAVYSSDLCRASMTAKIVAADREIPMVCSKDMREIGFGDQEGRFIARIEDDPQDPIHNFFLHPDRYIPPKTAESFDSLYSRSDRFLREVILPLEGKYDTVLLVAHGAWNRSVVNPLAGVDRAHFWEIPMENCAVSILDCKNGRLELEERSRVFS